MPQMSPMNWLMMFLFFNGVLYVSIIKLNFVSTIILAPSYSGAPTKLLNKHLFMI